MRKQLDALMGKERDKSKSTFKDFRDDDVCKFYLAGLCPYSLFTQTRAEMGECPKLHSDPMNQRYERARAVQDYGYERELFLFLEDIVFNCDKSIERQQRKLQEKEKQRMQNDPTARQLHVLEEQAKILGEQGNLDEYAKVQEQILELKKEQQTKTPIIPSYDILNYKTQTHLLKVCEVCGCFLSKIESMERLEDHYRGKLHQGYEIVRGKLEELKGLKHTWNMTPSTLDKVEINDTEKRTNRNSSRENTRSSSKRSRSRSRSRRRYRRRSRSPKRKSRSRSKTRSRSPRKHKIRS